MNPFLSPNSRIFLVGLEKIVELITNIQKRITYEHIFGKFVSIQKYQVKISLIVQSGWFNALSGTYIHFCL